MKSKETIRKESPERGGWILRCLLAGALALGIGVAGIGIADELELGREVSVKNRLADGEEYEMDWGSLNRRGEELFNAMWTVQEGGGRPLTKGTGGDIADPANPLDFPRNFNRVSAPDANSCAGCHNLPRSGGGGDIVANVFVLGQRFDFLDFDDNAAPTVSSADERGTFTTLDEAANSRATIGMFGSGYIEMLARQMTQDLRDLAAGLEPGGSVAMVTKGVDFGTLTRLADGSYDTSALEGLPPSSMAASGSEPPSLILKPFHQAGAVTSVREFTNNAFNHHHGIQTTERFGEDVDADGDGYTNEMSVAEVTAATVYQTTLEVPGRRIPRFRPVEEAVLLGEQVFGQMGCTDCHISALPLDNWGWYITEPNPFNPDGNLQPGDAPELKINLNSASLPQPRLRAIDGVTWVPAFTDLKLHDITSGPDDPNREPLDQHATPGTDAFFEGNGHFLTKKLWGAANEAPYFHHGKFTTMRQAIEAHAGEAESQAAAWRAASDDERNAVIEFLKTLQVLPEDTRCRVIDEKNRCRHWPPEWAKSAELAESD